MARRILLVGDQSNRELWQDKLAVAGYTCHGVGTMMEAIEYLHSHAADTPMLVQENLRIAYPEAVSRSDIPAEFKVVPAMDRGVTLIQYARHHGLLNTETPAYLATIYPEAKKYAARPEGVTRVIRDLALTDDLAGQLQSPVFNARHGRRADDSTPQR